MSKIFAIAALLLALLLAALLVWVRSQRRIVVHEFSLQPDGGASRVLRLDPREGVAEWRDRIFEALRLETPEGPLRTRGPLLQAQLTLRIRLRTWRLGLPPWETAAEVDFGMPYALVFDPGPPAGWLPGADKPVVGLRPMSREHAMAEVMMFITAQLERNRAALDTYP